MILEVKGLRTHYGHGGYLENIFLTLEPGEILFIRCRVLLLGSVLLRSLMGLAEEAEGEVWFQGEDLLASPEPARLLELRKEIGMVYRTRGLISLLNVEQNIALPLGYHYDISRRALASCVQEVAELLEIEALLSLGAEELDEMQTRLVNLARALIARPRLLLIDGLLEGMPGLCERLMSAIGAYQERHGFGVIMTGRHQGMEFSTRSYQLSDHGLIPIRSATD